MRIIAGEARGRSIVAPKGINTRPTQDHVRESLFNILMHDTPDAVVLDLFAGSGALALEAVSRGAAEATLVDHNPQAIACINRNVETLRMDAHVTVMRSDWQTALERLKQEGKKFSLVFLDPPYLMRDTGQICTRMADAGLLKEDALVVIEHRSDAKPEPDQRFIERDRRRYGDTHIHFFAFQEGAREDV